MRSATVWSPFTCAMGLAIAALRLRAATSAISSSVWPASSHDRACSAAMLTASGHSGAT